jgi:hypothetical protein
MHLSLERLPQLEASLAICHVTAPDDVQATMRQWQLPGWLVGFLHREAPQRRTPSLCWHRDKSGSTIVPVIDMAKLSVHAAARVWGLFCRQHGMSIDVKPHVSIILYKDCKPNSVLSMISLTLALSSEQATWSRPLVNQTLSFQMWFSTSVLVKHWLVWLYLYQ